MLGGVGVGVGVGGGGQVLVSCTVFHSKKDFVREKKSATEKRKSNRNFLFFKLNTKPLKFKCGLADGGGWASWSTHARRGYPHLVILYKKAIPRYYKPFCTKEALKICFCLPLGFRQIFFLSKRVLSNIFVCLKGSVKRNTALYNVDK